MALTHDLSNMEPQSAKAAGKTAPVPAASVAANSAQHSNPENAFSLDNQSFSNKKVSIETPSQQ